jgi:hypothetical protein
MKRYYSIVVKGLGCLVVITSCALIFSASDARKGLHNPGALQTSTYTAEKLATMVPAARPEDVTTPKAIVNALHASVTGRGDATDWRRFRSLFLPGACLGSAGSTTSPEMHVMLQSVDDWMRLEKGSSQQGISYEETLFKVHIEQYGNIASAFYSHSDVETRGAEIKNVRRVNSCQMLFDGKRWWIASVVWNESQKRWDLPRELEP